MKRTEHQLSNIDETNKTAFCKVCGLVSIHLNICNNKWYCMRRLSKKKVEDFKIHVLSNICNESMTAICKKCGLTSILYKKDNDKSFYFRCNQSSGKNKKDKKKEFHRSIKKKFCEDCLFIPEHSRQLDIHHINGNHYDDRLENLKTVCHNCHRLYSLKYTNSNGYQLYEIICSECGFVAINPCQIDLHHIDGNHFNNNLNNLQRICANCHRLKHSNGEKDGDVREVWINYKRNNKINISYVNFRKKQLGY